MTLIHLALLFATIRLSQSASFSNAVCNDDRVDALLTKDIEARQPSDGAQISTSSFSVDVGNFDRISSSAVQPGTGTVYVIYSDGTSAFGDQYLGTLDPVTANITQIALVSTAASGTTPVFTGMTFDCLGILYGINGGETLDVGGAQGEIFTINITTGTLGDFSTPPADGAQQGDCNPLGFGGCTELVAYNSDDGLFYRISDAYDDANDGSGGAVGARLYVINSTGTTQAPIAGTFIPDGSCTGAQDVITAFEYIGNDLFYIACDVDFNCGTPGNEQIRILDVSAFPPTITITDTTNTVLAGPINPISGCAHGLVPYGPMAEMVCIPPDCSTTDNPTTNPTINPTANPTINPTVNPTLNPTMNPTVNPTVNPTIPTMDPIAGGSPDSSDSESSPDDDDDDSDSSSESVNGAKVLFNEGDYREYNEDEWDEQLQRNVVLDVNERSMVNIWLIVAGCFISNLMLFWCYYRNNASSRSSGPSSSNHSNV